MIPFSSEQTIAYLREVAVITSSLVVMGLINSGLPLARLLKQPTPSLTLLQERMSMIDSDHCFCVEV